MDDVVSKLKLLELPPHVLEMTVKELIEAGAQEVPENEAQENIVDAAASGGLEVTKTGAGMDAAPRHPSDGSELDKLSEPGEGAQIEAALKEGEQAEPVDWTAPDLFPIENQLLMEDISAESDSEFDDHLWNYNA